MREFKSIGGKYYNDEQTEEFLSLQGAEASTLDGFTILLRKKPSRAAVYEELFHAKQIREGKYDGSLMNRIECEIEAQLYLLENAESFELTAPEIQQTKEALDGYKKILEEQKGEEL